MQNSAAETTPLINVGSNEQKRKVIQWNIAVVLKKRDKAQSKTNSALTTDILVASEVFAITNSQLKRNHYSLLIFTNQSTSGWAGIA